MCTLSVRPRSIMMPNCCKLHLLKIQLKLMFKILFLDHEPFITSSQSVITAITATFGLVEDNIHDKSRHKEGE